MCISSCAVKMKASLHQHLPFLGGIFLGVGLMLVVVSITSPWSNQHHSLKKRDIKPVEEDAHYYIESVEEADSAKDEGVGGKQAHFLDIRGQIPREIGTGLQLRTSNAVNIDLLRTIVLVDTTQGSTAPSMTWAAGKEDMSYHAPDHGHTFAGDQHILSAFKEMCNTHLQHKWFLLTQNFVYVNLDALHDVTAILSHTDNILMGVNLASESSDCQAHHGILLSQSAFRKSCSHIRSCEDVLRTRSHGGFLQCLEQSTEIKCSDIAKVAKLGSVPQNKLHLLKSHSINLSELVFIGPVPIVEQLYSIHLMFTEAKIAQVQQYMFHLSEQMTSDPLRKVRPKRDSDGPNMEQSVLVSHGTMLNSTKDAFYEYFDGNGTLYPQSCKVEKKSLLGNTVFMTSRALAFEHFRDKMDKNMKNMESFGYRITKANSGVEYQFYLLDSHGHGNYHMHDRVYQTIVEHPYSNINIEKKVFQKAEDVIIVTMADDLTNLTSFLSLLINSCQVMVKSKAKCKVLLLYDNILLSVKELEELNEISDSFETRDVSISTLDISLDISSSSSIEMNSFQRALVKVSETLYDDSLVIFLHPKSRISEEFLWRCQVNSISGSSAYFPIPFQYTIQTGKAMGSSLKQTLANKSGFWKSTDFDTFCAHAKDLEKLSLMILPKSPRLLFQFLSSVLQLIRIPDSGVWRQWDDICPDLESRDSCVEDLIYQNM